MPSLAERLEELKPNIDDFVAMIRLGDEVHTTPLLHMELKNGDTTDTYWIHHNAFFSNSTNAMFPTFPYEEQFEEKYGKAPDKVFVRLRAMHEYAKGHLKKDNTGFLLLWWK